MKRFLKKNSLKILFALLIIAMFCFLSRMEYNTEVQESKGYAEKAGHVAFAAEASDEYNPSVQELIINYCHDYGIESDIPLAISELETGHYTSKAFTECNNVGGMSENEVPIKFDSLESGVNAFVKNLAENYFDEGLTTSEKIGKKYCPVNADGWADAVNELKER